MSAALGLGGRTGWNGPSQATAAQSPAALTARLYSCFNAAPFQPHPHLLSLSIQVAHTDAITQTSASGGGDLEARRAQAGEASLGVGAGPEGADLRGLGALVNVWRKENILRQSNHKASGSDKRSTIVAVTVTPYCVHNSFGCHRRSL